MAMRAMPQVTGPKVLRIGKVQGGRVIEERVIKQRTHVTIGSSHTNMFLASGANVPETMRLFELVGNEYVINMSEAMTGRVALPTGVTDVAQARASGVAKRVGNFYQLKLTEDSRGKVVVGDTTFLFQFVAPPPVQPKPQLPLAVKGGLASQIDWGFTIIAAFSFLLHFGFAGAVNSDWFDPIVDDDAETASLIQQAKDRPAPPIEEKKEEAPDPNAKKEDDSKKAPEPAKAAPAGGKPGAQAPGPKGGGVTAKQGAALSNELDQLEMKALGSLGGQGPAQSSIMKPGSSAADSSLDAVAAKGGGIDTSGTGLKTGVGGGGPLGPGQGGKGGLAGVGDTKGGGGGGGGGGVDTSSQVKAPTGIVSSGAAAGASNVKDVDSVIARNRWRFKACLDKALAIDPTAGGTVKVSVRVGEGGEVTSASSASSDAPSGLTSCIVSAFNAMKFSPPDGGSAQFTAPVVLTSSKK
ncbi:MAG: AgmX/PglI C-terminal domain-containing protein [Polyangiales bacterium]